MRAWMVVGIVVAFSFCMAAGCGPKKTEDLPAVDVTDVKTEPVATTTPVPGTTERPSTMPRQPVEKAPPKTAVEKPAAGAGEQTYTVQKGDTLFKISHKFYGDGKLWTKIFDANKDKYKDASKIPVGAILKIPPK